MDNLLKRGFEHFAVVATKVAGSSAAFALSLLIVVSWAVTGPLFHFSDTWQLVINTGTSIVTFLMVFIIQKSQNKDSLAIQLKLNELIASSKDASNRVVKAENLTEEELQDLSKYYALMANRVQTGNKKNSQHSIDENLKNRSGL